jgi:hypothetical protein
MHFSNNDKHQLERLRHAVALQEAILKELLELAASGFTFPSPVQTKLDELRSRLDAHGQVDHVFKENQR